MDESIESDFDWGKKFSKGACKDQIKRVYFQGLLDKDTELYLYLLALEWGKSYRHISIRREDFKTNSDWIVARLMKIAEPVPCSLGVGSGVDFTCKGSVTFSDRTLSTLRAHWLRLLGKTFYEIEGGRTQGFPDYVVIYPMPIAPEILKRTATVFYSESGLDEMFKRRNFFILSNEMANEVRSRIGSLRNVWLDPYRLSLRTRIVTVFALSAGCIGLAMGVLFSEMCGYAYTSRNTKAVRHKNAGPGNLSKLLKNRITINMSNAIKDFFCIMLRGLSRISHLSLQRKIKAKIKQNMTCS